MARVGSVRIIFHLGMTVLTGGLWFVGLCIRALIRH
jgi:hypothetical protein